MGSAAGGVVNVTVETAANMGQFIGEHRQIPGKTPVKTEAHIRELRHEKPDTAAERS